jgi:hypothetical protein
MPLSSFHVGSVGSLTKKVETTPTAFSGPVGLITTATETDTFVKKMCGFQPMSSILQIACTVGPTL